MKYCGIFTIAVLLVCLGSSTIMADPVKTGPDLPNSSMWIPWADFKQILDKLTEAKVTPDPKPPYEALVSAADYQAKVTGDAVSVTIEARIVVLASKGWASLPIMRSGVPISDARLDGEPVALAKESDGLLYLIARGPGSHTLSLKMELNLEKNSGPEHFTLPTLRAQVNRLEVEVGKPNLKIMIAPRGTLVSKTVGASSIATGAFPPMENVTIRWARSVPQAVKETARVSAEVRTMLTVGEGLGVYTAIIDYDIQHKPISKFTMILPVDVTVADVSTEGLVDWNVEKSDEGQQLILSIAYEAIGRHQVAVTYERTLPEGETTSFATSDLVIDDVVHEVGYLAVAVQTNVQVSPKEGTLKNLATLDQMELPPDLRGNNDQKVLLGYKYIKHPAHLELEVIKHKDASVLTCEVEQANYKIMLTDRGKMLTEAAYRVANRSLQYLTLTLPEGMDLWGVYRDGKPIKAAESDGKILIPIFSNTVRKTSTLKVVAYKKTRSLCFLGRRNIELPKLDVGASKVYLELFLPHRFHSLRFGGNLRPSHQAPAVVSTSSLEGKRDISGLAGMVDDEVSAGEGLGGYDKDMLNENIRYRAEQSQVQKQVINIPVAAANAMYNPSMARGALPVEFDVVWEGRLHRFATSIVDPGEKANVTFIYSRRSRSSLIPLIALFCAGFIGYLVTRTILARRTTAVEKPARKAGKYGIAALILVALLALFHAGVKSAAVIGVIAGTIIMLIRYIAIQVKHAQKKAGPPKQKKPAPQTPPPPAPPKPPVTPKAPTGDAEKKEEGGES